MAPRQAAYLSSHLNGLQCSLAEKGIPLIYKEVSDFSAQCQAVQAICEQYDVTHLFTTISTNSMNVSGIVSWRKSCMM